MPHPTRRTLLGAAALLPAASARAQDAFPNRPLRMILPVGPGGLTDAVGRILASPTVSCPPAVPIAVSGEVLDMQSLALFAACGITAVDVAVLR